MSGEAMIYRPSIGARIVRWFGFNKGCITEVPPDISNRLSHWGKTVTRIKFDFRERLLILVTGCVRIEVEHAMQYDPGQIYSTAATSVRWSHDDDGFGGKATG
jgi:hypothetical protein